MKCLLLVFGMTIPDTEFSMISYMISTGVQLIDDSNTSAGVQHDSACIVE